MSIARVPGYSLLSNLDRQGIDLQFTTTGNTLTYMDFTNFRFGINTVAPTQALDVVGNVRISGNILTVGNLLANIGNVTNWYRTVHADSIISTRLTGTIQTAAQPNITQLGTLANLTVTGNVSAGNITVSGGIGISGNVTVSNMTANTYTGNIVTANQPFITNLANISLTSLTATGNVSANWLVSTNANISNIYGNISTANQPFITNLANITVTNITVTSNLRINGNTIADNVSANVITENGFRVLTSNTNVTITGDATSSGNVSNVRLTLANTGVTAGTYGASTVVPTLVVDSKGRITSAANVTLTKVGNVTVNDTTLTTAGNITLRPSSNIVDAGNSRIANVAAPVANTDVVTLSYLNSALSSAANILTAGDSVVRLTDAGSANLSTILDGALTSVSTASATTFYHAVTAGALTINGNTISSTANIVLDTPSGIVQILGSDAVRIPAGTTGDRPSGPLLGYTRFNTDTDLIETWDGNTWASPGAQTVTSETITPDGVANTFTLSSNVNSAYGVLVSINGTLQQPVTAYDVVGNQLSFTEIPQSSDVIEVRTIAAGVTVSALQYGATEVMLTEGNVNVTGNLIPTANIIYSLGNEQFQWKDLWVSSNTIYIGGTAITVSNGQILLNGGGVSSSYGNSNVASYLSTHTGDVTASTIFANNYRYGNGVSLLDGIVNEFTSNAAFQAGLLGNIQSTFAQLSGATFTGNITAPRLNLTSAPLTISSGGTGANTASKALENLLPNSSAASGYVLTANGDGTFYWEMPQISPPGVFETTYETLNKNISAYNYVINRTGSTITSVVYTLPNSQTITKEFFYNIEGQLSSLAIYGQPLGSAVYTKNLTYSGTSVSGASYSVL